jgi:phosphoribosyl 1,2-cyclic phosphodiesterase
MHIRVWGARGSIPVSGRNYLKYGGDTTCLEIRTRSDDIFIVDAGTGIRRLGNRLIEEERFSYYFLITHGHWDHLMGFPFFKPLYMDDVTIRVQRSPFPRKFIENMVTRVMTPPNFPVKFSGRRAKTIYEDGHPTSFEIGSVTVEPIPLSHPNMGSGYKFIENGKTFVFLTDNELEFTHPGGLAYNDYVEFAAGADLLFHDAEYTPEEYEAQVTWGHSAYTTALQMAIDAGVKKLGLFHMNQERTDDQVDAMVANCHKIIDAGGVDLECFAVGSDMIFEV